MDLLQIKQLVFGFLLYRSATQPVYHKQTTRPPHPNNYKLSYWANDVTNLAGNALYL